ncbi:hypothetical protein [Pelagibacterium montanilacus]|uniref:hypothetical protein n=1 Tax=Pelagibacterium montanilacus TaxID=2185280 RepID=UPI000F8ED2BA|nr:hypothetical protein [Pelagibacterium montanilacus]
MLSTTKNWAVTFYQPARFAVRCAFACALFVLICLASALPGAAQERLSVEAEQGEGFGRLIFTFPERTSLPPHDVASDNGVLVVAFETVLDGALPDVAALLAPYTTVARFDPDRRSVRVGLRGPVQVNAMEAGEQLYVDLLPSDWVGLPPGLPPEAVERLTRRAEEAAQLAEERRRAELVAEYQPAASVRMGRHPTFSRIVFDWNVGTGASFERTEDGGAAITFDWPVPVDLYEVLSDRPEELIAATNTPGTVDTRVELTLAEDVQTRFYEETPSRFILDIDSRDPIAGALDITALPGAEPLVSTASSIAGAPADPADEAGADVLQTTLVPQVTDEGATVRLTFPFQEDVPSAAFRRGDVLWMVFDTHVEIEAPTEIPPALAALAGDLTIRHDQGVAIITMTLLQDRLATLGSEGRSWVLSLGDVVLDATGPMVLERRRAASGLDEITVAVPRAGGVHTIHDPDVGDRLEIVTLHPPARGMLRDLDYVEFAAPRSIHGLVIRPRTEEVRVGLEGDLAVVSAPAGLTLSPDIDVRFRVPVASRDTAMDLAPYIESNPEEFRERHRSIASRASASEGRALDQARLELSRFYLANDFINEALGVLGNLRADLRNSELDVPTRVLWAAANALAGRPEPALDALADERLRDEADAMIWRTLARAERGDFSGARLDAQGGAEVIDDYPNWIRSRFLLTAARASLMSEDAQGAGRFFQRIDLAQLDREQIGEYELLIGMLDELNGNAAAALESYGRAITADRRPTTAEAVLRTITLLDRMGRLDPERALPAVEVQAALWRGDAIELELVELMTDLQYRTGKYREAFTVTREIAEMFDETTIVPAMVDRARAEFAGLYLDGGADALDPVAALGIYYDFRQLTPPGAEGDLMIRNLAQRLVHVDLLGQAAELLQYQVDHRLQGAARAQVATDLALVHIANRAPDAALRVLYQSRLAGLPSELERQRRVLEARALVDANRQDLALDILSSMSGRDVDLLRIEAYWTSRRYRESAELIETLYSGSLPDGLSSLARINVVKAAVGYVLADDALGLSRLRSRFSPAMAETSEWPMFAFVVEDVAPDSREFRQIAHEVAGLDSLNAFLNAYREIYSGSSALAPLHASRDL